MAWYNTNWNYRKSIIISNSGSTLTNYQILITIDTATLVTATKMRSDCGDIRFASSDGSTLIDYWIESGCNTSSTKIWVEIPSISSGPNTIYIYYGNSSATSSSNGDNTFLFFDDFSGSSIDTSKWDVIGTGMSFSSGILTYAANTGTGGDTGSRAKSITTFGTNTAIESRYYQDHTGRNAGQIGYNRYPSTNTASITDASSTTSDVAFATVDSSGTINYNLAGTWTTDWGRASIRRIGSSSVYISRIADDGSPSYSWTSTANLPTGNLSVFIGGVIHPDNLAFSQMFDWILVRNYTSTEPTICIGEEVPIISWLTNWDRRKCMTITGSSSSQTDYQIKIIVHKSSGTDTSTDVYLGTNVNDDFSDLRFTTNDGTTLLNYWIETYTSGSVATVWIKIPSIPAGPCTVTSYIYYGNSGASTLSDGTNTFILFDNFPGSTVDTTKWNVTGSPTVSGGTLTVPTGATVISKTNFPSPIVLEFNSSYVSTGGSSTSIIQGFYLSSTNERLFHYADRNGNNIVHIYKSGTGTAVNTNWSSSSYKRKIIWNKNIPRINWYQNDIESTGSPFTTSANIPINNMPVYFGGSGEYGTIYVSQVFIRLYTSPEPTTCIGGEELSSPSWLTNWNRRKLLTISGSTNIQTDYQMKLTVHKSSGTDTSTDIYLGTNVKDDFSDLRFTTSDGSTILNYWIESYTSGSVALIWIKISSIPVSPCTTTIYLYYDNPSATSLSNGDNTFLFFDDFSGSSFDTNKWQTTTNMSIGGSNAYTTLNDARLISLYSFTPSNVSVEARASVNAAQGYYYTRELVIADNTIYANPKYVCFGAMSTTNFNYRDTYTGGTFTTPFDGSYHRFSIQRTTGSYTLVFDSQTATVGTTNSPTTTSYIHAGTDTNGGGLNLDWIFTRNLTSPEPTFSSIGTEETVTCGTPSANLIVLEILSEQLSRPYPYYIDIDTISKLLDNFK